MGIEGNLLAGINPVQRKAVLHDSGPLLVVAGAGSGKTRVLTYRIAHLIAERHVSPFEILAITFTNKAADEMRRRVGGLVGPVAERMWVSTFHSACVRMLRRDATRLGYGSSFTIYDEADSVRLTGFVLADLNLDSRRFPPRAVNAAISQAKNQLIDFEMYRERAKGLYERKIADVYIEYQRRLVAANAMDFDDLLMVTVNLLQADPEVLGHYQERFSHILVDEYQDTNKAQNELILLLGARHRNVCVVGDTDQSIYRFRGAEIGNILDFERAFPDTTVITLEQNYRSTQVILDSANAVIGNNVMRKPKALWTDQPGGDRIKRYHAEDERDEAAWVAEEIVRLHDSGVCRWGEKAVFYRTNAQSRVIEEELVHREVPYKVIGGTRFYDRREIKDVLAYLRVILNPSDEVSLKRVVNVPRRGVGATTVSRLDAWAARRGIPFVEALRQAEQAGVTGKALRGLRSFFGLLDELRAIVAEDGQDASPGRLIEVVLSRTGYAAELEEEASVEAAGRLDNLAELAGAAGEHNGLAEFLEQVALVSDSDELTDDDSNVVLMTLHTAKGLEFSVVFLVGMEDGVFPHLRALREPAELEEERRLCYVGLTRARQHVYVSHAWRRYLWGVAQYNLPSRFLAELPSSLVEEVEFEAGRPGVLREDLAEELGPVGELAMQSGGRSGGSPRVTPVRTKGAERLGLLPGDDVVHGRWGEGVVLEVSGQGEDAEATINFSSVGEKVLYLAWAPLKRA